MPSITFTADTALGLIQQMQQFITDTSCIAIHPHTNLVGIPENAGSTLVVGTVEQPETPNANPPGLDVNGFPWDARIHSGGKSVNADGSWRYKKGVDKTVIQQIEAELSAKPNTAGFTESVQPVQAPIAPPAPQVQTTPVAAPAPVAPPTPVAVATTIDAAAIIGLIGQKGLDVPTRVKPVLAQFGMNELPEIFTPTNAPMLPAIYAAINALV